LWKKILHTWSRLPCKNDEGAQLFFGFYFIFHLFVITFLLGGFTPHWRICGRKRICMRLLAGTRIIGIPNAFRVASCPIALAILRFKKDAAFDPYLSDKSQYECHIERVTCL